jgi:transposase
VAQRPVSVQPRRVFRTDQFKVFKINRATNQLEFWVEAAGCQRLFLPADSPGLNPINHLWAAFKIRPRKDQHEN